MLSAERVAALQAECFADGVAPPDGAGWWSEVHLREYFESSRLEVRKAWNDQLPIRNPHVGSERRRLRVWVWVWVWVWV